MSKLNETTLEKTSSSLQAHTYLGCPQFPRSILAHLEHRHGQLLGFWTAGTGIPIDASIEDHCDIIYSMVLLGLAEWLAPGACELFVKKLQTAKLPGWRGGTGKMLSVHNCAYAFGALNLLPGDTAHHYDRVLEGRELVLGEIVDTNTWRPRFPAKWAYHNWRVSHWLGGTPSLLLSVARSGGRQADKFNEIFEKVYETRDSYLDQQTGSIRAYSSHTLHKIFQRLYSVRHDPALGDLGGIAHILWVDHAIGAPHLSSKAVYNRAVEQFRLRQPFMEPMPYCLDFDIAQIVRTCREPGAPSSQADIHRAALMMRDIEKFFSAEVCADYDLHKIPGALAAYHECALIRDIGLTELGPTQDIISLAHWI